MPIREPIFRPLFFDFPNEAECYKENDASCFAAIFSLRRFGSPAPPAAVSGSEDRGRLVRRPNGRAACVRRKSG